MRAVQNRMLQLRQVRVGPDLQQRPAAGGHKADDQDRERGDQEEERGPPVVTTLDPLCVGGEFERESGDEEDDRARVSWGRLI